MAKHVIIEGYTFTPGTKTVVVNGKTIRQEQLMLITNVTANVVIYNFSDPSLGSTSYVQAFDTTTALETTTIVLDYNTAGMNSTDKLSILVEETYQEITPSETLRDPVDKLRVSTPQSLIDTDFEYGTQPTKWETLYRVNNRPTGFIDVQSPITFTGISGAGSTRVVTVTTTTPPAVGTFIFVSGTLDVNADGWYRVETVSAGTNFTYIAKANVTNGSVFDSTKSYIWTVSTYSGSAIPVSASAGAAFTNVGTTVTCTTTNDHGLSPGNGIWVTGTTAATSNPPNGAWLVATTPTNTTFTFTVITAPVGTITASAGATATLFPRPFGFIVHRAFDGGVQFSAGTSSHNYQTTRQTRRYFRYQSGKGVQFSTGSMMKPLFTVDNITSSGTTVTITTKYPHYVAANAFIRVVGCDQTAYNGTFQVSSITDLTIVYTAGSVPAASPATGFPNIQVGPASWYGSQNKIGMFDDQNGFFFEFDGQSLNVVRRNSTQQISGRVAVTNGSMSVTGVSTKFATELKPGDFIVIRGQSYRISYILSETSMGIYPEYRGTTTTSGVVVSKTIDYKIGQSSWNIDKMDGTGASGFNADLNKIQMWYIDYSWYGAGAIRYGFKDQRGEVKYCHRMPHANIMPEAYMRSGNLPSRYENTTISPYTYLTVTLSSTATAGDLIYVNSTAGFPPTGTVMLKAAAATGAVIEYITYTAKTSTTLTIGARAQTGGQGAAQTFTYSATAPIQLELYAPVTDCTLSHWGSSVIMDGRFDDDKSYIFQAGMTTATTIAGTANSALISIRLAPSVDTGLTGLLGAREVINRMQLTLRQMDILVTAASGAPAYRIELILNGRVSSGTFAPVGGSSLAQICFHAGGTTVTGGETIFSFFADTRVTQQDLQLVRDLGNSILGGGTSLTAPTTTSNLFPDGPDIITIRATNVTATSGAVNARISWTEAQA